MPWIHAILRGTKVFARVDASGAFAAESGRVEIRYKPNDGRKYAARAENLSAVSGEILPDETCAPAGPVADAKSASIEAKRTAGVTTTDPATAGASPLGAPATGATAATTRAPARAKRASKTIGSPIAGSSVASDTTAAGGATSASAAAPTSAAAPAATTTELIHVYADGACSGNPGPAGLGVVILDGDSRVEISEYIGHGTNNIAELTAILRALTDTADQARPLLIHTDSSYSIGVLQKGWKAKANPALIASVRDVLRGRPGTRLVYVPGHAGVAWNERADALARAAVTTRNNARNVVRSTPAALAARDVRPSLQRG